MRNILILVLISPLFVFSVRAQEEMSPPPSQDAQPSILGNNLSSRNNDFDYIRAEITRLLVENKRLEAKFSALRQQLDGLKGEVEGKEREVEKVAPRDWQEKRSRERQINSIKALYSDAEKLKNDLAVKKSRNAYLSAQLLDMEEKQRLWKLRLSDAEYLKRELELDLKMMEYELREREQNREQTINDLRREIQKNMEQEREILNRISAIEDGSYYSPSKAAAVENENDRLEIKIQALEHELGFKEREIDILDKKRMLAAKSRGIVVNKRLEERNRLRKDVEILKMKTEQLSRALDESLVQKVQRETVLKDFIHMQQENDKLREQLSAVEQALNSASK